MASRLALCLGAVLAFAPDWLGAADLTVTTTADTADGVCDTHCSLREAVIAANALPGIDRIVLPAGTYVLTRAGRLEDDGFTGDLDFTQAAVLEGAGAATTIIDANRSDRVLDVCPKLCGAGVVEVHGVTVRNGYLDNPLDIGGAGIRVQRVPLRVLDSVVRDNEVEPGTGGEGGGIDAASPVELLRSEVLSNLAFGGGGVRVTGRLMATDSIFRLNESDNGNGAGLQATEADIDRSSIIENLGEGVRVTGPGNLDLLNSTVDSNTFWGLFLDQDLAGTIRSATIASNGQGLNLEDNTQIEIGNTILDGNNCNVSLAAALTSLGHNIDSGNTCNFNQPTDLVNTDPLLGPLGINGGLTPVRPIAEASPARRAGGGCPVVDQRGLPRGGGSRICACDIGAFELQDTAELACYGAFVIGPDYLTAVRLDVPETVDSIALTSPMSITASPDGSTVYVGGELASGATGALGEAFSQALAAGFAGYVAMVDAASFLVFDTAFLPMAPSALAAHATLDRLYAAGPGGPYLGTLVEIEASTATVLRTVPLDVGFCTGGSAVTPHEMVYSAVTGRLLTTFDAGSDFSVLSPVAHDATSLTWEGCAELFGRQLAVDTDGSTAYVVDAGLQQVHAVDVASMIASGPIPQGFSGAFYPPTDVATPELDVNFYVSGTINSFSVPFPGVFSVGAATGLANREVSTAAPPQAFAISGDERMVAHLEPGTDLLRVTDRELLTGGSVPLTAPADLVVLSLPCPSVRSFANRQIDDAETFRARSRLLTGPSFVVESGGEASLTIGDGESARVELGNGTSVQDGGTLVVRAVANPCGSP